MTQLEFRRAAEELREQAERHRLIVYASPDAVVMADAERGVTAWNPAAAAMFGLVTGEADFDAIHARPTAEPAANELPAILPAVPLRAAA